MQKKENPVIHFATVGIAKVLWIHSRAALFLFVIPTWLFAFTQLGIVIGLSLSTVAYATGFYCIGGFCFFLMLGSLWLGFRLAQGFCRILALVQIGIATLFSLVAAYRNIVGPAGPPFEPDSVETIVAVFLMFVLFVVIVLADVARAMMGQRAIE